MILPTLYKKTKTGSIQIWVVSTDNNIITVTQGKLGGKMQEYYTTCTGKNLGKANSTSNKEQAELEAIAKQAKQQKAGYSINPDGEILVKLPMKVKVYQDNIKNVIFPCFASPKLDGGNAIYRLEGAKLTLWSRGGDEYPPIPHLEPHIRLIMSSLKCKELNGELYIHGTHLQDLTGAIRKSKELSKSLEFYIFDIPDNQSTYEERMKLLLNAHVHESRPVKVIQVAGMETEADIEEYHDICVAKGYEGIVIRNARGLYKYNERSSDVFKLKIAKDAEFLIVAYDIDKNKHPVFHCVIGGPNGDKLFKVKPTGTNEQRLDMVKNIKDYIGKWYKIQFESYSKAGIPTKPVGICLRHCDKNGNPSE